MVKNDRAVKISAETEVALRTGLVATRMAIANYASACRSLRRMPEALAVAPQMDLSISRLDAMHQDLESRAVPNSSQDALFVSLLVAQAGLSALTDAIGEMRESYSLLQPHAAPTPGWYDEDPQDAVSLREDAPTETRKNRIP